MGRTYNNSSGNLAEMTAPMRIDVSRTDNVSFDRAVMVSPMGTARVVVNTP
jgi:hypothetical protein